MSVTREEVRCAYILMLGREPLVEEIEMWLGVPNLHKLREMFVSGNEWRSFARPLIVDNDPSHQGQLPLHKSEAKAVQNLIFDIGMSEGNDTAFYLAKGFQVVGVEADPVVCANLAHRFASEIADNRLTLLNRAAASTDGEICEFWRNEAAQGLSALVYGRISQYGAELKPYQTQTTSWNYLQSLHGVPHYCKIDIEGAEIPFLESMVTANCLPTFISVEAHSFAPVEQLFLMGNRKFKIVDQNILHTFLPLPNPQLDTSKNLLPALDSI